MPGDRGAPFAISDVGGTVGGPAAQLGGTVAMRMSDSAARLAEHASLGGTAAMAMSASAALTGQPGPLIYGPAIAFDSLANTVITIGTNYSNPNYYRFRCTQSSALTAIEFYCIANGNTGYSNGTGGSYRITLNLVDVNGFPIGSALATANIWTPQNPSVPSSGMFTISFPSPFTTTAGQIYALQFLNIDASPGVNYASLDGIFTSIQQSPKREPKYPDTDWGWGYWTSSAFTERTTQTPILDVTYANGNHDGVGYMEGSFNTDRGIISGVNYVREQITVSGGTRSGINSISFFMYKESGSDPLTVRVETSGGTNIQTVTIPAASFAVAVGNPWAYGAGWATAPLALMSLTNGSSYNVQLSCPGTSTYGINPIRKGSIDYGYSTQTVFTDGNCQKSANSGSTWASLGRVSNENDLGFYFS